MKSPPAQFTDDEAREQVEAFIRGDGAEATPRDPVKRKAARVRKGRTGERMKIVIFGLSISSSWGNGHATLWRGLCRALAARGHDVVFFERDVPYYAAHRDLPELPGRSSFSIASGMRDQRAGPPAS